MTWNGIKDYQQDPDENTAINGIDIDEDCAPSGINNALRQIMADIATARDRGEGDRFAPDDGLVDADQAFVQPGKSYLTNTDTESPNLNFPVELTPPIWFEVFISDDGAAVTQTAWDNRAAHVFTRVGEVNDSDPENPLVTWTPWNSVAVPETVKNVETEVDPQGQPEGTYLVITFDTENGDETVYINLSQIIGAGYSAGNAGIGISSDNKISLNIDTSQSDNALQITENGAYVPPLAGDPFTVQQVFASYDEMLDSLDEDKPEDGAFFVVEADDYLNEADPDEGLYRYNAAEESFELVCHLRGPQGPQGEPGYSVQFTTTDLEAGVSDLDDGLLYCVYED